MRSLSNPEYVQFLQDNAALVGSLVPNQSTIVSWGGMSVLVYIGANPIDPGNGNLYPDIYLSDVSDAPQLAALTGGQTIAPPQSMLDALPQAVKDTVASEAATAGTLINSAGKVATDLVANILAAAGQGIAAGAQPILSSLTPILVGALVILGLMYLPRK